MSRCLKPQAVAERLDVPTHRVWWLVRTGKLRAIRIGRQIRVPEDALAEFEAGGGCPSDAIATA